MPMRLLLATFALAASGGAALAADPLPAADPPASAGNVAALAWMSGCWEATGGEGKVTFHEMWMKPAGGVMIGAGRTLSGARAIFTESLQIREEADGVTYWARPQGSDAPVGFKLGKQSDGSVLFENPGHDFPTRILYDRLPEGGLRARVEGPKDAKETAQEFVYRRVSCE
jgi:hypothetical protein